MPEADRRALAERQAALVAALAGEAEVPEGLDAARVARAARSLHHKRSRGVQKSWPALAAHLGGRFDALFAEYAKTHPILGTGPAEDWLGFTGWLLHRRLLDDYGVPHLVAHRAGRGWPVRWGWLRIGGRLVIAVRLGRVRVIEIPVAPRAFRRAEKTTGKPSGPPVPPE